MKQNRFAQLFLDQSDDLIWIIDPDFQLVYANNAYQHLIKKVTGDEKELGELVFIKDLGEDNIEKWKGYYNRAINGETFDIEEDLYAANNKETRYNRTSFKPIYEDDHKVCAVVCESKDITSYVKKRYEANKLIDASLDVFCSFDEEGRFIHVSAASEELWGYLPEEMAGKPITDFVLEEDIPKTNDIAADILKGEETKTFVNRYRKKDGGIAYNSWSARWDPKVKLGYSVARDNIDEIEQEEILYQSEQRFKALVQEGSDLIGILDEEGNYKYVSPTSIQVLGISPEEFIGRNAFEFIHPEDVSRVEASLQQITTDTKVRIEAFRFQNYKREWRWVETVLTNMLDNPAVKGIVANSRDITTKIEKQHQLKLYEKVLGSTSDAMIITEARPLDDPGPKIIYVNKAFTKITGYTEEDALGKNPRFLQGPNTDKEKLDLLDKKLRRGESAETTVINYTKSGEEYWVNFVVNPVVDQRGVLTHFTSVQRDVTLQKNKEQEKDLLAQISRNFAREDEYIDAAMGLCKTVSEFGNLDWVELWTTNIEGSHLQLIGHHFKESDDEVFYTESNNLLPLETEKGLPGKVWSKKQHVIWGDIGNNKDFVRQKSAKKIGVKSAMGIPLTFQNRTIGVILLGTKKEVGHLKKYTVLFEQLQEFIGSEINRKKLENDLHSLYNTIPDIVCLTNFKGKFLKINRAGCELLGYKEKEILLQNVDQYSHPEDKQIFSNELSSLEKNETSFKFENRYLTKDGSTIWLSWYCNISREEGVVYATARNITERNRLRELQKQASEMAKIGSWEVDLANDKGYWSEEVHQLFETDPETFYPNLERSVEFFKEEYQPLVQESIDKSITEKKIVDLEAQIVTAKRNERWVRVVGRAEFNEDSPTKLLGSIQDITHRKEAEVRLQSLADNLPGVVFQYFIYPDGKDELKYVTKGSREVWGFSAEDVIENNQLVWAQIQAGGDIDVVQESIGNAVSNKSKWTSRWKYVMPTGEIKTHLGLGTPSFLADGTVVFDSVILDVSEEAKNEELLKQTANMARIGSWEIDLANSEKDNVLWSPLIREILEFKDDNKATLLDGVTFYIDDSKAQVSRALESLINEGIEFDEELLAITGKGNERWVRAIGKCELINNQCTKLYGSIQDIHEQKTSSLKLKESLKDLEDYKFSLDQSAIIASTDSKGVITYINDNFCKISQYDREEIIGNTHRLINSKHHDKAFFKDLWKTIGSGEVWRGEIKNLAKDGTYYWVDTTIVPFLDENDKPIQYLAIRFDITLRKEATLDLEQANERFEKVTEATNDAIWDWDIKDDNLYWGKGYKNLFGFEIDKIDVEFDFWSERIHPDDTKRVILNLTEALEGTSDSLKNEYRFRRVDGSYATVIDRGVIIRDAKGEAIRIVGALTDISERIRSQEELKELNESLKKYALELERSNEELEQFAFITSHDMQEPLRMISSFMDQLKRKYEDQLDDKAIQYINFATDGAKRMKQIILDLLRYSRTIRPTDEKENVDLNEVLIDYQQLRRKVISEKSVSIRFDKLPVFKTYKAVITQLFHGLLDNAIKYSKAGISPVIDIKVEEKEDKWLFSVRDNGIGIDPKFFDKIFDIFQRLHDRDEYKGTGIGLSITKRSVEFLGGEIWLSSELGVGTIFFFTVAKDQLK